jgi:dihydropteroate synthase-like protein
VPEHILFLTGRLAERSLHKLLEDMQPLDFSYEIRQMGISVAALMTTDMIRRRLKDTAGAARIILPGRCRGDIQALAQQLGARVERGPDELKDLPTYFGRETLPVDLSRYDVQIFAEIVDAPHRDVASILERAQGYREDGAEVIDLGCLPDTPFPHLEETVAALKGAGHGVSVDSMRSDELLRAGRAGADFLLSLHEDTLWVAEEVAAIPILIPSPPSDLGSLLRAVEAMERRDRPYIADAILDPIHTGFMNSLARYHALRRRLPQAPIMMGVGNLTELTHADTAGINALLMGIISELGITHLLTTEVSPHCRRAVREADLARRILFAARQQQVPPRHVDDGLMALHERRPFPYDLAEIRAFAEAVRDPSYRIQVSEGGIHIYNRDGLHTATDPFDLYPVLDLANDPGHAFYLGVELARAQIAWQLGKRYDQDEALRWGCAVRPKPQDLDRPKEPGPTMEKRPRRRRNVKKDRP